MSVIEGVTEPGVALGLGLVEVRQTLAALEQLELHGVPAPGLAAALSEMEAVRRQVESLNARMLAVTEADGRWALDGARSFAAWYRALTGRHHASTAREVRSARTLRDHLPATARAWASGQISADHVSALIRYATDTPARLARLADPEVGEGFLLTQAGQLDATQFTLLVRHWAVRADPDAADRGWKEDLGREELHLSRTMDGYLIKGWLTEANGDLVDRALQARVGVPDAEDRRTPTQRRANALVSLAHLVLDAGVLRPGARIRPHLAVTVPYPTLERLLAAAAARARTCPASCRHPGAAFGQPCPDHTGGSPVPERVIPAGLDPSLLLDADPATLADGTPLAPSCLGKLLCDSQLHRVVFGPDSDVIDVGREERLFTAAQTRAIIARDRHCQYPHCTAPAAEGEIHHSIWWWAQHGPTNTKLGILLCWFHHEVVHSKELAIERFEDHWRFTRPNGTVLGTTPFNPAVRR